MDIENLRPELRSYAARFNPVRPAHLGTRYKEDGVFLPEPGNTVVCHLTSGSDSHAAIEAARQRFLAMPDANLLAFTPVSSLHMTLFQGIIEYRRRQPYWPEDLPLETPIDDMTALFLDRLAGFEAPGPFAVEVTDATPAGLALDGVTPEDRATLKLWRDRLANIFGYRHPDHDDYIFHITFAYPLTRFGDEAILRWQDMLADLVREIRERAPLIELNPPAFCSFADMNHFEELLVLEPSRWRANRNR